MKMAKRLLAAVTLAAQLAAASPVQAGAPQVPSRPAGMSAYVMMVLEVFFGADIGAHISWMAWAMHHQDPAQSGPGHFPSGDDGIIQEEELLF